MMPMADLLVHVYVLVDDALSAGRCRCPGAPAGRRRARTRRC